MRPAYGFIGNHALHVRNGIKTTSLSLTFSFLVQVVKTAVETLAAESSNFVESLGCNSPHQVCKKTVTNHCGCMLCIRISKIKGDAKVRVQAWHGTKMHMKLRSKPQTVVRCDHTFDGYYLSRRGRMPLGFRPRSIIRYMLLT